jgi:hypothetical protein
VSPAGSAVVLIVTIVDPEPVMEIESAWLAASGGELESVTFTVKLDLPADIGVPLITPFVALIATPAGSVPVVIDQT